MGEHKQQTSVDGVDINTNGAEQASKKRRLNELEGKDDISSKERKRSKNQSNEKAKEEAYQTKRTKKTHQLEERNASDDTARSEMNERLENKRSRKKKRGEQTIPSAPLTSLNSSAETTPAPPPAPTVVAAYLSGNQIVINTPPNEDTVTPVLEFSQLDVPTGLRDILLAQGFTKPTPIQACAWPALLRGKDVVGVAETGSGKTLAFGIPGFGRLLATRSQAMDKKEPLPISILVIAPTRELALQTHETLDTIGRQYGVGSICIYGGVDKDSQRKEMRVKGKERELSIVVGTPGRLLDFVEEGCLDLSRVTYLVLDEADRMLDRGFENDIRRIIERTANSSERQTVMFSATWPESVRRLASTFQRNPIKVTVGSEALTANGRVEQVVEVFDDPRSKDSRLLKLLQKLHPKNTKSSNLRVLVFALYKLEASRVTQMLERNGYSVSSLHGALSQPQRIAALEEFKTGHTRLMVATDVAARGLDIPEVEVVINYTFPLTLEDYVHRIGRTGRGGRSGKSITYFTGENHERGLAGELAKVLHESGFECEGLKKFPMTIRKKEHSAYGAFFKETSGATVGKKIRF